MLVYKHICILALFTCVTFSPRFTAVWAESISNVRVKRALGMTSVKGDVRNPGNNYILELAEFETTGRRKSAADLKEAHRDGESQFLASNRTNSGEARESMEQ